MREEVRARGADLGIALDGDADRVIVVDERGQVVDGDQLMGVIARSWAAAGRLKADCVTATVMSNHGLERFLGRAEYRHVLHRGRRPLCRREDALDRLQAVGGEQSGHIILGDYSTTGDGLMAALQVMAPNRRDRQEGERSLPTFLRLRPQLLRNVRYGEWAAAVEARRVQAGDRRREARLGGAGRLVICNSGTEPVVRVMAAGRGRGAARLSSTIFAKRSCRSPGIGTERVRAPSSG